MSWRVLEGDATERLRELDAGSVQTVITSPPYWGLRDYGDTGQLGLEPTPEQYVANLVAVFREVRRTLRDDGTVWLNLGDSYASGNSGQTLGSHSGDMKPKDLCGIPWMVAFALRADGWWLRSDIVWAKPNPMPESVTDRPTRSHEYIFLLTKSARYFYDADAIREDNQGRPSGNGFVRDHRLTYQNADGTARGVEDERTPGGGRNKRSVWTVATQPFPGAHFATFPPKLIEPCVLAGSPPKCCGECGAPWERVVERQEPSYWSERKEADFSGRKRTNPNSPDGDNYASISHGRPDNSGVGYSSNQTLGWAPTCRCVSETINNAVVLDPFCGAGTTGVVALRHDRDFVGIELNPEYAEMARNRIRDDAPLFNVSSEHEPRQSG